MKLALNEDLRYNSYKHHRGHQLTEKAHENRLTKGKKLLSKVKHPAEPQTIKLFSDEKNVCQDQKHNSQNNRWLAYSPKDTPCVMQTTFSKTVTVFGCVSCEADVMPLHFHRESLRLNSDEYVELLITVVKPRITWVANGRPHVWRQDLAPCHTFLKSTKWLSAIFYNYSSPNVWPLNPTDPNPMDYYIWSAVEKDTNRCASTTKSQLINKIKAISKTLPRESET